MHALVQFRMQSTPVAQLENPRLHIRRIVAQSAAQFAVHSGGFSESDAHAFNRLCRRVAPSFQRVGATGASLD